MYKASAAAMNDRESLRIHSGRAGDEAERRKRHEIGRVARVVGGVAIPSGNRPNQFLLEDDRRSRPRDGATRQR